MLVIKDVAGIDVNYPIERFCDKEKILYFDIETTGLSRKYCSIYLIGAMYFEDGEWMYAQWFADNYNDEANVIMAFQKFIKDYDCLIHFNGNSFDIPFVKERAEKYNIDLDLDRLKSVDIYKDISSLKFLLNLPNLRQKTLEEAVGLDRKDPFSGGELVEVYKEYVRTKDQKLIYPLLLHNREDVLYMGKITELLALCDLFNGEFGLDSWKIKTYKDMNGNEQKELVIDLETKDHLPLGISFNDNDTSIISRDNKCQIKIKTIEASLKLFFENYKEYYYLPAEDKAIHKSVSQFVDKEHRVQAKASTCYEVIEGTFVPSNNMNCKYTFKNDYSDKNCFIKVSDLNNENINEYVKQFLNGLLNK